MPRASVGPVLRPDRLGIYYIHWSEKGRSKRASTRTGNLQEAQKVLAGFLLEQSKQDEGELSLSDVFAFYTENHIDKKVVASDRQKRALAEVEAFIGGDRLVSSLSVEDFHRYAEARMKTPSKKGGGKRGKTIDRATVRRELGPVIAAFNFAVRNKKLDSRSTPVISLPDGNPSKERWMTRDEAAALMAAMPDDAAGRLGRIYRFAAIALGTGRRRDAIEKLSWFQVDLKNRVIDFRKPGQNETAKRRGRSPISDWLFPILERAFREKVSEYVLDHTSPAYDSFIRAAARAGMHDISPHTCRHTWGTWAAQAGESMWNIAAVMNCTVQTATNNYLHHSPEHLRDVANRVGGVGR